ncbi:MAG: ABC transporter ATP-binding protein [Acidaminobacteraceae bacterium]
MSENNQDKMKSPRKSSGIGRGPGGGMSMSGEKAKNFKPTMKRLLKYLDPYKTSIITVIIFAILSAAFGIYGPKLLGKATTEVFKGLISSVSGNGDGINFDSIATIMLTLLVLYGLSTVFSYIQGFIMSGVSMKVSYNMRKNISKKINKMPLKYFDETSHGEVLSRVTNDVDTVSQTLNQSMSQIITSFTTVVGVLIMMLSISFSMTLIALFIIPISMVIVLFIVKRSQKHFKDQQKYLGNVNGHIEEMFSGHVVVKTFNGEEKSAKTFEELNDKLYGTAWKSQFLSGLMMPAMTIVGNMGYVAVCVLGGALAAKRTIEVGDIQAFVQYVRNFTMPISQLANASNVLQQTAAAAERVFEFLDESEEIIETINPVIIDNLLGNVEFKNVNFGYNKENIIINNFSATIKPGQKVALVGPTGAGKTTMVKLLMRFYDVNDGSILIDNTDIKDFTRNELRKNFGMVLQDTWLYNSTIMENIRYGRLSASDDEVIEAAIAAHVDSFVHMLPDGYNMMLNEDASNVSQGQKQLITIARAILSNPKILILDEATSSVDTRTEIQIQRAMNNLMEDRTSFIIAHRLSTIRDADLILVMEHGDIVEQGHHTELLLRNGAYANLYNSQFDIVEAS